MLRKATQWFKALSKVGKIGVITALGIVGIASASAGKPPQSPPVPKNCASSTSTETVKEKVPFSKSQQDDPSLDIGQNPVKTAGVDGEKTITYTVNTYSPTNCKSNTKVKTKEEVTKQPVTEVTLNGTKEPEVTPAPFTPPQRSQSNCNPNYSPCVPNVSYDLDCADIGFRVIVTGADPYHLDADHDGIGCDSY